jgi:hypothetical protein
MSDKKTIVMLPSGWPMPFRRAVRDASGAAVKSLQFEPGVAVGLTPDELEAVRDDIGVVLHIAKECEQKPGVFKTDREATAAFVSATKVMRDKQREERSKGKPAVVAAVQPTSVLAKPAQTAPAKDADKKGK